MDRRELLLKYLERLGPYAGGLAAMICGLLLRDQVVNAFGATGMSAKDSAGAVFNVLVTLSAFLFSVFVLAIAPGGGFIEKIFRTATFKIFKRYVIEALLLGAVASLCSVPFMTTATGAGVWNSGFAQSIWAGLVVAATLAFLRVVHIFIYWVGYDGAQRRARRA